jgi:hypothetical protein
MVSKIFLRKPRLKIHPIIIDITFTITMPVLLPPIGDNKRLTTKDNIVIPINKPAKTHIWLIAALQDVFKTDGKSNLDSMY